MLDHDINTAIELAREQEYMLEADAAALETFLNPPLSIRPNHFLAFTRHRNSLAPSINRLPVDILLEIFFLLPPARPLHNYPSEYECQYFDSPRPWHGPLLLGQVCRTWKDVADSNSFLWSLIPFDMSYYNQSLAFSPWPLANWLARSKTHSLFVAIYGQEYNHSYCTEDHWHNIRRHLSITSSLLFSSRARWRAVKFDTMCIPFLSKIIHRELPFPNLRDIFIDIEWRYEPDRILTFLPFFTQASNLRNVFIKTFHSDHSSVRLSTVMLRNLLSTTQLSNIRLPEQSFTVAELNQFLQIQLRLELLEIRELEFDTVIAYHDSLSTLILHELVYPDESTSNIQMEALHLPNLTRISLPSASCTAGTIFLLHLLTTSSRVSDISFLNWPASLPFACHFLIPHPMLTIEVNMALVVVPFDGGFTRSLLEDWIYALPNFIRHAYDQV
ncbi:hypothetical protein DL96DRAFT_1811800 [Flagelloscypha sp. PMI_526]|nr:hypothetical protein DL96DRAFT_1811800 [Flagelloscypha sp. PMI_526]